MTHFKSTGVCFLILSLNLLNTKIYLLIVIWTYSRRFTWTDSWRFVSKDWPEFIYVSWERTAQQKMISSVQWLVVDRQIFIALLSKGHGLLPGGLPGSSGYLGREIFMVVSGRASNKRRKHLYRANDSVRSGFSSVIVDQRSGTKPWTWWQHCASIV
jgi:hypothetical protein